MYKCFARYPTLTKHVFAWILVFIFTVGPLVNDEYGQVGEYCWIKSNRSNSDAYRFIFFYAPLWMVILWEYVSLSLSLMFSRRKHITKHMQKQILRVHPNRPCVSITEKARFDFRSSRLTSEKDSVLAWYVSFNSNCDVAFWYSESFAKLHRT